MPNSKGGTATAKAKAVADARNIEALEIALSFVDQMYNDLKVKPGVVVRNAFMVRKFPGF
jgi:hypothetical protein